SRGGISRKANCALAAVKKQSGSSNKFEGQRRCRRCLHPRSYNMRGCKSRRGKSTKRSLSSAKQEKRTRRRKCASKSISNRDAQCTRRLNFRTQPNVVRLWEK